MTRKPLSILRRGFRKFPLLIGISLFLTLSPLLLAGCIKRGGPTAVVQRFMLEYSPPSFSGLAKIDQTIKIERFSAMKAYSTRSMVYRPEPYKLDTYASNHWMVNPGDMISDFLLRDIRNADLFKAVFSYRDLEDARYALEGSVEEFLEVDNGRKRSAVIAVSVTLLDLSRTEASARLLLQKRYQAEELLREDTPAGLANAMSTGMKAVSTQLINDIHRVITSSQSDMK